MGLHERELEEMKEDAEEDMPQVKRVRRESSEESNESSESAEKTKCTKACIPCWRARKKCVRDNGSASCRRCVKHGKKCLARESASMELHKFERKKPSACEACHVGRRKCEFEPGQMRCKRCERTGKTCVLRAVLRGKAREVQECDHPFSFAMGRTDVLANYRSIMQMVGVYQELGHKKPPVFLYYLLRALGHAALVTGSTARLQSVATLALRAGIDFDIDFLRTLPEEEIDLSNYEREMDARFFHGTEGGACFIERAYVGRREVKANPTYASIFSTSAEIAAEHLKPTDCPYQMAWRKFVHAQEEACSQFFTNVTREALSAEVNPDTGFLEYSCTSTDTFVVHDRYGNQFRAHLFAHGLLGHEGAVAYFTFGFKKVDEDHTTEKKTDTQDDFRIVPGTPSQDMEWEALEFLLDDQSDAMSFIDFDL